MLGIFLDTETNGLDPKKHKILEIAFKIIDLQDGSLCDSFESVISISEQEWKDSDQTSLKVCGFLWEEIQKGLPIETVREEIKRLFKKHQLVRGKSVFICQNPSFDRAYFSQILDIPTQEHLYLPYHWLDLASMYWGRCMERAKNKPSSMPWETGFTKDKIAAHFNLPLEDHPHRAINGVNHLIKCYEACIGFPKKTSP